MRKSGLLYWVELAGVYIQTPTLYASTLRLPAASTEYPHPSP